MAYKITVGGEDLGVWDLDEVSLRDSFALKEVTGLDPLLIHAGLKTLNPAAWGGVIWYLRRKRNPKIRIDQIDFKWGDVDATEVGEQVPPPGAETTGAETSASDETSGSTPSDDSST